MTPIIVQAKNLPESMASTLLPALEQAYTKSSRPVKALVLTNPNNPLGQCYSETVLKDCLRFCGSRGIHLISDEVYALTELKGSTRDNSAPFISALALDASASECDPSLVHVVWSSSTDFGLSGVRLVRAMFRFRFSQLMIPSRVVPFLNTIRSSSPKLFHTQYSTDRLRHLYSI